MSEDTQKHKQTHTHTNTTNLSNATGQSEMANISPPPQEVPMKQCEKYLKEIVGSVFVRLDIY